jgi:hypothetical protein
MSWLRFGDPGFNHKSTAKTRPLLSARSGRDMAHLVGCQRSPDSRSEVPEMETAAALPVGEFMILTEFSRCQGRAIKRVSAVPKPLLLEIKDFP